MHRPLPLASKTAALVAALLLACTAAAQEARPAAPAAVPQVQKMTIYNGVVPTVSYSVQGGSPHLQALGQALQFTENEINLTGELQKLRLGIVANEQTLNSLHTWQQLGLAPINPPGGTVGDFTPDSALKCALIPGLAHEASPATAYALINLREQLQTELQAEQARAAAPVRGAPPAKQNPQPAVPPANQNPPPAAPPANQNPQPAAPPAGRGAAPPAAPVMVPVPVVSAQAPMPLDSVAIRQTGRQNQERARQQILQSLQPFYQMHR